MLRAVLVSLGMGLWVFLSSMVFAQEKARVSASEREDVRKQEARTPGASGEVRPPDVRGQSVKKSRAKASQPVRKARKKGSLPMTEPAVRETVVPDQKPFLREEARAGTVTGTAGDQSFRAWTSPVAPDERRRDDPVTPIQSSTLPTLGDQRQMDAAIVSGERVGSSGNVPSEEAASDSMFLSKHAPEATPVPASSTPTRETASKFSHLEIEVSHSGYILKLYGHHHNGNKDLLHECGVGLGSTGFQTPVGEYYVTHIYDDAPWWIPPKDRAWAAGQSPSKSVYGGTMAPLLKKRQARAPRKESPAEDKIEEAVTLNDDGYRFHGTNAPRSIGGNQSHGCVRMLPQDAKRVASLIKEHVGVKDRKEAANGSFVILHSPVRLNLVK